MFKKLFIFSIAASVLLSMPAVANNHRHECEKEKIKVKELVVEVKQNEKNNKNGLLQLVNKTAPLWSAVIAGFLVAKYGPFFLKNNQSVDQVFRSKVTEGAIAALGTGVGVYLVTKK